ncbi:uncharacterized protein IL334_007897 [Kwoniella shivajii]|uniref:ATP-dependent DNA helicase n=1 Tax=Kwoniella shivajii TaxID=564305 RepID=A0ABZ1D9Y2_9TREE|nr:hypothetical protein IL334_007897 [Kwoniella shivajii]
MSDDDFGDDAFLVDDSFLREVDNITASAQTEPKSNNLTRSVSLHNSRPVNTNNVSPKGWTGVQRSLSGPSSKPALKVSSSTFSPTETFKPNNRPLGISKRPPNLPPPPSSDDYDVIPLEPDSIAALDSLASRHPHPHQTSSASHRSQATTAPTVSALKTGFAPTSSGAGFGRTTSTGGGGTNGFLQTHLNFRRENQTTKGKTWDRTQFAESGRRVGVEKGKGKGKGRAKRKSRDWEEEEEEDEEDEEEDDWGDVMAPAPKPLVDMTASYEPQRHLPNSATIGTYIYPTNRSKRDYQYDIIRACFKDNCLVALPTGLGKTFVAGVVMLNFYRWFPTGKIVFLAPTKPLVNQQIEACQLSCGIPSKDAAVMTGSSVGAKGRARLWEDRRVFYCTPQTLENDLKKGSVDPRDIVLAVFDEAHKASGGYAYTTILAYVTAHHPYFRVLALTATPGADVPKVQAVVDALHISRIEIREAEAPEIKKYMNEKRTERHVVEMNDVIEGFRDRWATLMRPNVAKLVDKEILNERDLDCKRLRPFRLTAKRMEIAKDRNSGRSWAFGSLTALEKMARAMGNLLEFSLGMFHTTLVEIAGGVNASGKKSNTKGSANSVRNNTEFQKLLRDVEIEMNMIRIGKDGRTKADKHPKMQTTLELLLAHFTQAEEEETTLGQRNDTRAMVFCSYRECVLDIVEMLNQHSGLLKATKFVGQSQGKQEADKGFNQKEQKKTINEFKEGKYNILVSTSIGEEGLDIGEVDFVVIYDMPKQSIKLLQRIGRTGRKRDGKVHVLMSENREDTNWDTAQQTHRDIQEEILHSRNLELFEDVEPLLPDKFPECVEQEMEIDPWDPGDKAFQKPLMEVEKLVRKSKAKAERAALAQNQGKGKGRGNDVPEGAEGFKSVAELLRGAGKLPKKGSNSDEDEDEGEDNLDERPKKKKQPAKGKKRGREPSPIRSESGDDDEQENLESFFAETESRSKSKGKKVVVKRTKKPSENTSTKSTSRSKKAASLADIDMNIHSESEPNVQPKKTDKNAQSRSGQEKRDASERQRQMESDRKALDFFNTAGPVRRGMSKSPIISPSPSPSRSPSPLKRKSLLLASPGITKDLTNYNMDGNEKLTPRTAAAAGFSQIAPIDLSWDMDIDEEDLSPILRKSTNNTNRTPGGTMLPPPFPSVSKYSLPESSSPFAPSHPLDNALETGVSSTPAPQTQFPVRGGPKLGMRRPRPIVISSGGISADSPFRTKPPSGVIVPSSGPDPESPLVMGNRQRRRVVAASSSPVVERSEVVVRRGGGNAKKKEKRNKGPIGKFLDMDAELSGSDSGDSSEHSDSSNASSSDLKFAGNFQPTQAPKGYNQRAIYLAGLGTQARGHGLEFKRDFNDARREFLSKAKKPVYITDDEDDDDDDDHQRGVGLAMGRPTNGGGGTRSSDNEYELGSFVVDDDDDDDL